MKTLSWQLRKRIEAEELANIMYDLQQKESINHVFLSSPEVLAWHRRKWMEITGVIFLAVAVSAIAIIANYIIFLRMLHVYF